MTTTIVFRTAWEKFFPKAIMLLAILNLILLLGFFHYDLPSFNNITTAALTIFCLIIDFKGWKKFAMAIPITLNVVMLFYNIICCLDEHKIALESPPHQIQEEITIKPPEWSRFEGHLSINGKSTHIQLFTTDLKKLKDAPQMISYRVWDGKYNIIKGTAMWDSKTLQLHNGITLELYEDTKNVFLKSTTASEGNLRAF